MAQCLVDIVVFCLGAKTHSHISKHSNSLKRAVIIQAGKMEHRESASRFRDSSGHQQKSL